MLYWNWLSISPDQAYRSMLIHVTQRRYTGIEGILRSGVGHKKSQDVVR